MSEPQQNVSHLITPRTNVPERLIMDANRRHLNRKKWSQNESSGLLNRTTMSVSKVHEQLERFDKYQQAKNEKLQKRKEIKLQAEMEKLADEQPCTIHDHYIDTNKLASGSAKKRVAEVASHRLYSKGEMHKQNQEHHRQEKLKKEWINFKKNQVGYKGSFGEYLEASGEDKNSVFERLYYDSESRHNRVLIDDPPSDYIPNRLLSKSRNSDKIARRRRVLEKQYHTCTFCINELH